jgi:hypothetical protein
VELPALLSLVRRSSREEFVRQFDHPFLVRPRLSVTAYGEDDEFASTDIRHFDGGGDAPDEEARPGAMRYVPLTRNSNSPYTDRITVGRTSNCDVVLKDRSISKLHALFWPAPVVHGWAVSDARSANGTWVNDKRLEPLAREALKPGDHIRLGEVETRFIDAGLLYEMLLRRLPRPVR